MPMIENYTLTRSDVTGITTGFKDLNKNKWSSKDWFNINCS